MKACFECGTELIEGAKFCFSCGTRVKRFCKECGMELHQDAKFCHGCGIKVAQRSEISTVVSVEKDIAECSWDELGGVATTSEETDSGVTKKTTRRYF